MLKFLGEMPDGPFPEAEVEHPEHLLPVRFGRRLDSHLADLLAAFNLGRALDIAASCAHNVVSRLRKYGTYDVPQGNSSYDQNMKHVVHAIGSGSPNL
jgi:hypothetical protein